MLFIVYGIISIVVFMTCFMIDKFFRETFKKYCNIIVGMVRKNKK